MRATARLSILSFVLALHLARPALGASEGEADALVARGLDLREAGRDDDALALFKRAFALAPSPRTRAQVALAEQALGMWVAAEADLSAALAATEDPWIAQHRAALEGALAVVRRHVGSLDVRGADGAEVAIDGVKLGNLPVKAPFRVEAGRRTLEVTQAGHYPTSRAVEIPAGGVARETVTLVRLPPQTATPRSGPAPEGAAPRDGRGQRMLGWVFAGTGGALLATGGVSLLVRAGIVDDYNTRCPGLGAAQPADCDAKIDSARTWLTVSIVSFVAGGVLAAGGVALVVTAPRDERKAAWCTPAIGSIACGVTF